MLINDPDWLYAEAADSFRLAVDNVASDATNTPVCQGSKVFNAEVVSTFVPCTERVKRLGSFCDGSLLIGFAGIEK